MKLQPVILCGGTGTRLWPLSREQYPKQLLALAGDVSMPQATALRLKIDTGRGDMEVLAPLVVGNEKYRFITSHSERAALGENGRSYLVTHLSKEKVLKYYEDIFLRASGC